MASRLALVNCKGAHEGPWTNANGRESGLEIFMLGKGAHIRFEYEAEGLSEFLTFDESGVYSLPNVKMQRYRVVKVGDSHSGTIVRVQLNGKS